jgi:lipocalin
VLLRTFLLGAMLGVAAPAFAADVDLARMAGEWYVLGDLGEADDGHVGRRFQLEARDGGYAVTERYFDRDFEHEEQSRDGRIGIADAPANTRWRINFSWSTAQEWRVIFVDDRYANAVLAQPARGRALLLARERYISDERFNAMLDALTAQRLDALKVLRVPQGSEFIGAPGFHGVER